jgi:hypothetical protein
MTQTEALRLALEALEKLWGIIDDIDTYGDMAKADEKLYRTLVERRQRQRFEETGISTDGYELHGGAITAIKAALEAKDEPWSPVSIGVDVTKDGVHVVGIYALDADTSQIFYAKHHPVPQRTWVGLTNEERMDILLNLNWDKKLSHMDTALAIEAKLKEKNT